MRFLTKWKARGWIFGLLFAGICFAAAAFQGDFSVIWQKASVICLECIGIG